MLDAHPSRGSHWDLRADRADPTLYGRSWNVGEITTDVSRWPVVVVRAPATVSDEEMAEHLAFFEGKVYARREPFVTVLDLRFCEKITPRQRSIMIGSMKRNEEMTQCRGCAMVFDSMLLRGILTAMFWVRKPAYPTRVFSKVVEAFDWAEALMVRSGRSSSSPSPSDDPSDGSVVVWGEGWVLQSDATREPDQARTAVDVLRRCGIAARLERETRGSLDLVLARSQPFSKRDELLALRSSPELARLDLNVVWHGGHKKAG